MPFAVRVVSVDTVRVSEPTPSRMHVHGVFFSDGADSAEWSPVDPTCFYVQGMAFVGPAEDGPTDAFDFAVCTPRWLVGAVEAAPTDGTLAGSRWWLAGRQVLLGRGMIFVARWSRQLVEQAITEAFSGISGPTWGFAAERAGRLLPWEYDYQHDDRIDDFMRTRPEGL